MIGFEAVIHDDELSALLRSEGVRAEDVDALVAWAQGRARDLVVSVGSTESPPNGSRGGTLSLGSSSSASPSLDYATQAEFRSVPPPIPRRAGARRSAPEPEPEPARTSPLEGHGAPALDEHPAEVVDSANPEGATDVPAHRVNSFLEEAFALLTEEKRADTVPTGPEAIEVLDHDEVELVDDADLELELDDSPPEPMGDGVPAWRAALASAEMAVGEPTDRGRERVTARRGSPRRPATR